ncbi:MAG: DUF92 domain-containing protein [Candidatus Eisenbacteria bacterium]|uniref:DUF92 domain-containing protein n=1 Tax=Eiseniibacteriota bacterium TaxID=2212470 RepID=A0A538TBL3_UNCEI|nr:MAG: DUF92 domain-containing protein [Candidatus Eisenbacteria bacterium]
MRLNPSAPWGALLALAGAALVLVTRQGTRSGALAGFLVALIATAGLGAAAFVPLALFVLGSGLLTRTGRAKKERLGMAENNEGRRGVRHVTAKLALPAAAGGLALFGAAPDAILVLAYVAALAGAFADTAATELGPVIGGRVLALHGFRIVAAAHGTPGGVSAPGLLAGAGSALLAAIAASGVGLLPATSAWIAACAGFLGSVLESALAPTALGARVGHFGRNVFVSAASAGLALGASALGRIGS